MSERREWQHRRRRDEATTPNLLVQIGAGLAALGKLIFGRATSAKFNHVQLLAEFSRIEQLLESNDQIHAAQAVVRADSFLDGIFRQAGGRGASFADRLRSLESSFGKPLYQAIWDAHKLRNTIAHEHVDVSVAGARVALQTYRRAASTLGAF